MKAFLRLILLVYPFLGKESFGQLPQLAQRENILSMPLNRVGMDAASRGSMGLIPLFSVRENWIHENLDLAGADYQRMPDSVKIIPPVHLGNLSYGYFFQQHESSVWEPNRLLFVVENGTHWSRSAVSRIWVDRNHNLDFTDDKPDTLYKGQMRQTLWFSAHSEHASGVNIQVFPTNRFYKFSQMNDMSVREMAGPRVFLGTESSLKVERINIRYAPFLFRRDTLAIGILDVNSNGVFGDKGIDQWVISDVYNPAISTQYTVPVQSSSEFAWMGYAYRLTQDSARAGSNYLSLTPVLKPSKHHKSLLNDSKIPAFKFCVAQKNGQRKHARKLGNKTSVWVIWSAENANYNADSTSLHDLSRQYASTANWLFLNFGGSGKYVSYYNRRYDLSVLHGFCNSRIADKLKLQSLPQYLVWSERKRLLFNTSNVDDLREYLENMRK